MLDVLIACCDGLTGLPDAIVAVYPNTVVQTCVVHVIRNAMRFVSYKDRKKIAKAMREIYTAATLEGAELALTEFDKAFGSQYPGAVDVWRLAWNEFIPFLDYPSELRKIVYTTNAIESINFQLRKITKNRGHFPDKDAAMKLLYLGLRNISSHRGGRAPALFRIGLICSLLRSSVGSCRRARLLMIFQVSMPKDLVRSRARVCIFPDQSCS